MIRSVTVRTTDINTGVLAKPLAPKDFKQAIDAINTFNELCSLVPLACLVV